MAITDALALSAAYRPGARGFIADGAIEVGGRLPLNYLDVPFEETIRRHATKPQASEYGRAEMSAWYRGSDLLPGGIDDVIPATSTLDATVGRILRDIRLPAPGAVAPAPPPG